MRKVYAVRGWQRVEVTKWVKAESEQDAMDIVENMNISLEDYVNNTIGLDNDDAAELTEGGNYIEWEDAEEDVDHDYDMDTDKYRFEIWFEGNMIHDSGDDEYDDDWEAESEAESWIEDYIEENEMDAEVSDFNIDIEEV